MNADASSLREAFDNAGQSQVFRFFDELDTAQQEHLLEQAAQIDLAEIARLKRDLIDRKEQGVDFSSLQPAPYIALPESGGDADLWQRMKALGEQALRDCRVAAFTVAGGQGTRLGFDGPKGTYPVTPVRQATLFQVFAEKIRAASDRYGYALPWFIMTSVINHEATESFFKENNYFGLQPGQVTCFRQGLMPAVDLDGKILLEDRHCIAMSPDGHGGSLRALVRSGAVAAMKERNIDIISYFQVDNPLVKCIDPAFIGFHLDTGSEMSSKTLPKAYPKEKVGNFSIYEGKTCVIEYSDLPDELAERRTEDGELAFKGGSIAIHILNRAFVERMGGDDAANALPFHRADKKIAVYDEAAGQSVNPESPNGVKFEMFVFDALPFAANPVIIETARKDDFSPVKNPEGIDSAVSSREDQLREAARWLKAAGETVPCDDSGLPSIQIEISPLFADCEAVFVEKWRQLAERPRITNGLVIR